MSKKNVYWIFGRGASIECNLNWNIPQSNGLGRSVRIQNICSGLKSAQDSCLINIEPYKQLLSLLEERTNVKDGWKHTFSTLNWDTLFERAIAELDWSIVSQWVTSSWIYHWNGSIETGENIETTEADLLLRSPFVLPADLPSSRNKKSVEGNNAFNQMGWTNALIICGVSLSNPCDDTLVHLIEWVNDKLPIGECHCIIVNNDKEALNQISDKLQKYMWRRMTLVESGLKGWLNRNCPELQEIGILIQGRIS